MLKDFLGQYCEDAHKIRHSVSSFYGGLLCTAAFCLGPLLFLVSWSPQGILASGLIGFVALLSAILHVNPLRQETLTSPSGKTLKLLAVRDLLMGALIAFSVLSPAAALFGFCWLLFSSYPGR